MTEALIIKDGLVVRGQAGARTCARADVIVENGYITGVGPGLAGTAGGTVLDASDARHPDDLKTRDAFCFGDDHDGPDVEKDVSAASTPITTRARWTRSCG